MKMGQTESKESIYKEFEKLEENAKAYTQTSEGQCSVGKQSSNSAKNRYMNILPFDATRVKLKNEESDYINANYIRMDGDDGHVYIATQGPTDQTLADFWEMVWEQETNTIIMLANEFEAGRSKVTRYWPDSTSDTATYGNVKVNFANEKENKHYCIRNFKISHSDKPEQVRDIRQFHYTSWPDFGVPTTGEGVMEMREEIIGWQGKAPPVVHCSAGVGRTGTYVAIDTGLAQQAANKREANIYQLTETMKKQRQGMVQTPEQYEFIYTTLRQADAAQPE